MPKDNNQTNQPTKRKRGRPFVELTPQQIDEVERMAAYLNKEQIAACLGIAENTFTRLTRENESIDAAYKRGRASKVDKVADSLFKMATHETKPNVIAAIYYLKARGGSAWLESQPERERQQINISYSPAQPREERDITPPPDAIEG